MPKAVEPKPLRPHLDLARLRMRIENSLAQPDPEHALVDLVREFFAEGFDEGEAYGMLLWYQGRLRAEDIDSDAIEDPLVAVMDYLSGWCSPGAVLQRGANEAS